MRATPIGVLASGGLDSAALLARLSLTHTVWPIYVQQGLRWEKAELHWLKRFLRVFRPKALRPLTVLQLPMRDVYADHWSTGGAGVPGARSADAAVYLPGRNMILTVKAAVFAATKGMGSLALGSLDHNPFADASPAFFRLWGQALSQGLGKPLSITAPFRAMSKADVIRRYAYAPLHLSFSCLAPKGVQHCGHCNKCGERQRAFVAAKVMDKTRYV